MKIDKTDSASIAQLALFFGLSLAIMYALRFSEAAGLVHGSLVLSVLSLSSPTIAALAVLAFSGNKEQWAAFLCRLSRFRFPIRWILIAGTFFLVPLVVGFSTFFNGEGGPNLNFTFGEFVSVIVATLVFGPLTEEPGWRGYALPELLALTTEVRASAILGFFWGLWHLPFWFLDGSIQSQLPGGSWSFAVFVLIAMVLSLVYTWIFIATKQSLPAVIALHFFVNLSGSALLQSTRILSMTQFVTAIVGVSLILGLLALMSWQRD